MTKPTTPTAPTEKTAVITLNTPIERTGGPITHLTLRKPKAGDLRGFGLQAMMTSDVNALIGVLPRISDPFITDVEAANLEADDLAEIGGALLGFFLTPAQKAQAAAMSGA